MRHWGLNPEPHIYHANTLPLILGSFLLFSAYILGLLGPFPRGWW
jgi:hypothetical protein